MIQIRQRYPGHARNVLHVAANCRRRVRGKWTVVVDEDVDCSRHRPGAVGDVHALRPDVDIDLIQKAWSSSRDPMFLPGNFNNRILIDACIPYDMKLRGTFPTVVDVSGNMRSKLRAKFPDIFSADVAV